MELKAKTTIDITFTDAEIETLSDAYYLFSWIEGDLKSYAHKNAEIVFDGTTYSCSDLQKMARLLNDMVNEYSHKER